LKRVKYQVPRPPELHRAETIAVICGPHRMKAFTAKDLPAIPEVLIQGSQVAVDAGTIP